MESSDTKHVLAATARLIQKTRAVVPTYAAGFCGIGTHEVSALLVHTRTQLVERRYDSGAKGMAFSYGAGEHVISLNSAATRSDQMFTIRHELAHILGGEVEEALLLTSDDTLSFSERRADLFAIADLTPTRWLTWLRRSRRPWYHVRMEVKQAFRELTEDWSEQRLNDRADLRVLLYREHGI